MKRTTSLKGFLMLLNFLFILNINLATKLQGQVSLSPAIGLYPTIGRSFVFAKNNTFLPNYYEGHMLIKKHTYTVILKSGATYTGKTRMQLNNGRSYLKFKEKDGYKRFYPKDTKEIIALTGKDIKMTGIPAFGDTSWIFQVSKGRINTFSVIPSWETLYISAVQKNTLSPPVRINQANIIKMVQDNPKALKKARKKRLWDAIIIYNKEEKQQHQQPSNKY